MSEKCTSPVGPGLPAGAPKLTVGTWVNVSPPGFPPADNVFTQGIAVDPCNPAVIYLTVSAFDVRYGGVFKSTDAGSSWNKVGNLDEPIRVRIDPKNTQHLYAADGVRGGTEGFWESTDGGQSFAQPQSFKDLQTTQKLFPYDVYDISVDPTDFKHFLLSFHGAWGWTDTKWNATAGVLESTDGGNTWIVHEPAGWTGAGHAINFLYQPSLGIGDSQTWLLGTQGDGHWRTTNAGATWTKVTSESIQHGGGTIYYAKTGVVYATAADGLLRSTDNGQSWTRVAPNGGYNGIGGDGTRLYALKGFSAGPYTTSLETDGLTWKDYNSQQLGGGSFEIAYDSINGIVYSGNWTAGLWALKSQ